MNLCVDEIAGCKVCKHGAQTACWLYCHASFGSLMWLYLWFCQSYLLYSIWQLTNSSINLVIQYIVRQFDTNMTLCYLL